MRPHPEVPDMNRPSTVSAGPATRAVTPLHRAAPDPAVLGGKAAALARLADAGLPVPAGVVLTTAAFADAVRAAGDDPTALAVPDDLLADLLDRLAAWGDVPLAVRSSGVAEDGAAASFAGLYETVLDVRGEQALRAAVLTCWRSAFGARVRDYVRAEA